MVIAMTIQTNENKYNPNLKRVYIFQDLDNVRANVYENGNLFLHQIINRIRSIGHVEQYRMYLTSEEYSKDFDTIQNAVKQNLGTWDFRFSRILISDKSYNALDKRLCQDFYQIATRYRNTNVVFLILSGDQDFLHLRWYGESIGVHVFFKSPNQVRSRQLNPYSL